MQQRNKFKGLYQMSKLHKAAAIQSKNKVPSEPIINDDSLDDMGTQQTIIEPEVSKPPKNHNRSHSCPFELSISNSNRTLRNLLHHRSPSAIPQQFANEHDKGQSSQSQSKTQVSKKLQRISAKGLPFAKKNSSQSIKSVVIHNNDANSIYMSSILYSEKKIAQEEQRRTNIKKTSKRCAQKMLQEKAQLRNRYLKMKLEQQIKRHQLSQGLFRVEKEAADIMIKQNVFETILSKGGQDNKYINPDESVVFY